MTNFYIRKIQFNVLKVCFRHFFSKHAFSLCPYIKVYIVNLIKL